MQHDDHYDLGLQADLNMWMRSSLDRRRALRMGLAGLGTLLVGCGTTNAGSNNGGGGNACTGQIPGETAGPFPADGSNASGQQLNVLQRSGIVRSDIRTSLNTKNVAAGVPITIELSLVNINNCAALAGYAVYAWHCTRDGLYSMYSNGVTAEDFLRGVQATDNSGKASFVSVFPGCYAGRWPHVHFEVYPSLEKTTGSGNVVHTSQLALPEDVCKAVYASTPGYTASTGNLSRITLASDNVFRDGVDLQMATVTGNNTDGYNAKLTVGIAA
jgi:protocatechuate 3,4-dioxygenase beta subunit